MKLHKHKKNILIVLGVVVIGFGWTVRDSGGRKSDRRNGNLAMTAGAGILVAGFLSRKNWAEESEDKSEEKPYE